MRLTPEQVSIMLVDYVAHRRSVSDMADRYRMSPGAVRCILKGLTYPNVPRPDGFAYPWPKVARRYAQSTPMVWRTECKALLHRYVDERLTLDAFADLARVARNHARRILQGKEWRNIQRPAGMMYPWPEHVAKNSKRKLTIEQVTDGLRVFWENGWCVQQLADFWGIHRRSAAMIVHGEAYLEAPRPWRRLYRDELRRRDIAARWKGRAYDLHTAGRGSESSATGTDSPG